MRSALVGAAKWRRCGFVTPHDDGKDLFLHHSGIAGDGFKSLAEGAKLSYDAEAGDGPKAAGARALV